MENACMGHIEGIKQQHRRHQRYTGSHRSSRNKLTQILLASLHLFELLQVCSCTGTIEVHFLHFSGNDCDGFRDTCDPSFDFCLGRVQSWNLAVTDSNCQYGFVDANAETKEGRYDNREKLDLWNETSIHGIPNPWTVQTSSFYDVQSNGEDIDLMLAIVVEDWDDGGRDDAMYLWRLELVQKVWPTKELAQWQEHTKTQGRSGSITFKIRLYCDQGYYGAACETYCNHTGEYCCDSQGNKVLTKGSQCANSWPTTASTSQVTETATPTTTPSTTTSMKPANTKSTSTTTTPTITPSTITPMKSTTTKSTSITATPTRRSTSSTNTQTTTLLTTQTTPTIPTTQPTKSTTTSTIISQSTTSAKIAITSTNSTIGSSPTGLTRESIVSEKNTTLAVPLPTLARSPETPSRLEVAETAPGLSTRATARTNLEDTTDNASIPYILQGSNESVRRSGNRMSIIIAAAICGVAFILALVFITVYVTVMLRRKVKKNAELEKTNATVETETSNNGVGNIMGFMNALYVTSSTRRVSHDSALDYTDNSNLRSNPNLKFDTPPADDPQEKYWAENGAVGGASSGHTRGKYFENGEPGPDTHLKDSMFLSHETQVEENANVYSDLGM